MRSVRDDRTARAVIRDEALRLFAQHGPDAVSVRQIAAAAGVSAALVVHHFGSKEALREVVDRHVLETFDAMLAEMTGQGPEMYDPAATGSLVEAVQRHLPPDSPMPAYLRRMLLTDSAAGRELFAKLFTLSRGMLAALSEAGMATPGQDPAVRAALLMANDLAVLLLRDQLTEALGVDPLSREGMARWSAEMLAIYATGLLPPAQEQGGQP
ncbi:TetR/AcrR family transcriptional regulator [Catenulispora subtropica]